MSVLKINRKVAGLLPSQNHRLDNDRVSISPDETKNWFHYLPGNRWPQGGGAIVHHASGKLLLYTLFDGYTKQFSTNEKADFRYPHREATPN